MFFKKYNNSKFLPYKHKVPCRLPHLHLNCNDKLQQQNNSNNNENNTSTNPASALLCQQNTSTNDTFIWKSNLMNVITCTN